MTAAPGQIPRTQPLGIGEEQRRLAPAAGLRRPSGSAGVIEKIRGARQRVHGTPFHGNSSRDRNSADVPPRSTLYTRGRATRRKIFQQESPGMLTYGKRLDARALRWWGSGAAEPWPRRKSLAGRVVRRLHQPNPFHRMSERSLRFAIATTRTSAGTAARTGRGPLGNKWNSREFALRHGCRVPELYYAQQYFGELWQSAFPEPRARSNVPGTRKFCTPNRTECRISWTTRPAQVRAAPGVGSGSGDCLARRASSRETTILYLFAYAS